MALRRPFTAFTLIELLVVLSIIALLMGLLLPVLAGARRSARAVLCGGNQRQMTVALLGYLDDNDGSFFPEYEDVPSGKLWWFGFEASSGPTAEGERVLDRSRGRLWPYYQVADSIEICPAYPHQHAQYKPKFTSHWTTYGLSERLIEPDMPATLHLVRQPSSTLAFADTSQRNVFQPPASPSNPMFEQWHYVQANARTVLYLHDQTANIARLDGSVAASRPTASLDERIPGVPLGRPPATIRLTP